MGSLSEQPVVSVPDPRLPVPLVTSLDAITAAADDFGHLVHTVPVAVARPSTAKQVSDLVRYANAAGLAVRARGAGHAVAGQSQCDGIVCDVSLLNRVFEISGTLVSVGAGARWSTVLAATLPRGLTPPVLTDYLELSVGGTLSAGGIGGTSFIHGPQVDHVLELDVVTPSGDLVTCSSLSRPDVFYGALAAQGTGGIITRAVIPLVPAPERVRRYQITLSSVQALTGWQQQAAGSGQFGYLEGQIARDESGQWTYVAEAAAFGGLDAALVSGAGQVEAEDLSYLDFCHRMRPGVRQLAGTGDWYRPHPWFSAFLPPDLVTGYVTEALGELPPATLGPLPVLLDPLRRGLVPASGLATPDDELFFSLSILRTVHDLPMLVNAALTHNALLTARARLAGANDYAPLTALPTAAGPQEPDQSQPGWPRLPPQEKGIPGRRNRSLFVPEFREDEGLLRPSSE
jgi:cytokinin dehydrogenase